MNFKPANTDESCCHATMWLGHASEWLVGIGGKGEVYWETVGFPTHPLNQYTVCRTPFSRKWSNGRIASVSEKMRGHEAITRDEKEKICVGVIKEFFHLHLYTLPPLSHTFHHKTKFSFSSIVYNSHPIVEPDNIRDLWRLRNSLTDAAVQEISAPQQSNMSTD